MRITACALVVIALGLAAPVSAQPERLLRVETASGARIHTPAKAPYTTGGLVVPADPLKPGVTPRVSTFRIRAWTETPTVAGRGGGVRAVVFAIDAQQREQQIASVLVAMDQTVEITAPEKFNARRITLRVGNSTSAFRTVARPVPAPVPPPWRGGNGQYQGDVPTDPGLRGWEPSPRGSR